MGKQKGDKDNGNKVDGNRVDGNRDKGDKKKPSSDVLMTVLGMVVLLGGTFGIIIGWEYWSDRHLSDRLDGVALTSYGVLGVVGINHSAKGSGHTDYRLSLIDARGGQRKAMQVLDSYRPRCEELAGGNLWCRSKGELALLKLPTLEVQASWPALKKQLPELASGLDGEGGWIKVVGERVLVTANDGRTWLVGGAPPTAVAADAAAIKSAVEIALPKHLEYSAAVGGVSFDFGAWQGRRRHVRALPVGAKSSAAVESADTYLEGGFVTIHSLDRSPAVLPGPPSVLVLHKTSMQSSDAQQLLTRVDAQGKALWTRDLGHGHLQLAVFEGDMLTLVGDFPDGAALGLDPATGVERWRTGL